MSYSIEEMGLRLQRLRKQAGMTQAQLADSLNIAISTLGKIERGRQGTSIELLIDFALYLDASLDYIVFGYEFQRDKVKIALRRMANELMDMEKKL